MAKSTVAVNFTGDVSSLQRSIGQVDNKLGTLGKAAIGVGVGIAAGMGAGAVGLFKLGSSFDEQIDKIRVGTGAVGASLKGLEGSFKAVLSTVPASFDDAGTAIADLNTRLGLTGKPLEALASQMLNLSRITKTDLATNVDNLTRVFGDWGVATEDQAATLDKIYRAAQASGIGLEDLSTSVVQFGAPLRNLGFTLDDSLALLAQFNKTGVNTETVFAGLKAGVGTLAKAGEDIPTTFRRIVGEITALGPGTQATAKAIQLFGKRAGPDLADAIAGGKFELDALLGAITDGSDTVNKAAADTEDFAEKWTRLKNRVLVNLAPLASKVFDGIGRAMDRLGPVFDEVLGGFRALGAAFKAGDGEVTSTGFAGAMERIGLAARKVVDWFQLNWPKIRDAVVPVVRAIVTEVVRKFGEVVAWVKANWPQISEAIGHVVNVIRRIFSALAAFMAPLWDNIRGIIDGALRIIQGIISTALAIINGDWGKAWDGIKRIVSGAWEAIKAIVGGAVDVIKFLVGDSLRFIADLFLATAERITKAAAYAFGWVPGIGPKLQEAARAIERFRDETNAALGGIADKVINVSVNAGPQILGAQPLRNVPQGTGGGVLAPGVTINQTINGSGIPPEAALEQANRTLGWTVSRWSRRAG